MLFRMLLYWNRTRGGIPAHSDASIVVHFAFFGNPFSACAGFAGDPNDKTTQKEGPENSEPSDFCLSPGESPGMHEGVATPSWEIRSGGMYGARSGCKPLPLSFGVCPKGAREMMFSVPNPLQGREADLQRQLVVYSSLTRLYSDRSNSRFCWSAMSLGM